MATTQDTTSLVALESFVGKIGDEERIFRSGDLVKSNDPAVKKWPHLFGSARYHNEPRVEQATAAPGERRA
jgi:hypothetical protein